MSNYYLIIVWILIFAILSLCVQMERMEVVLGQKVRRMQPVWAVVLVLPLVIWTANRGYVGDTGAYLISFSEMPMSLSAIPEYITQMNKDKGFYFLSAVIKCMVGDRELVYLFIIGAVQAYLLFKVYRKYSTRYVVSFFLFIASTDYVSWMFNGMRQFVAVTVTFACLGLIVEKKYAKAIIGILFASLFHQSALLVLPFVFISQGKAWNKKTILFIAAALVLVLFADRFTGILDTMLQDTQYKNVVSDWQMLEDDGTNFIRVLVYAVPTILSLIGLKYIRKENNPIINICVNMSIVSMGLYIVSSFTSGVYIGRLPIYFSVYNYILLPWEIDHMFEEKSAKIVYLTMIGAYLAFYYIQLSLGWGMI